LYRETPSPARPRCATTIHEQRPTNKTRPFFNLKLHKDPSKDHIECHTYIFSLENAYPANLYDQNIRKQKLIGGLQGDALAMVESYLTARTEMGKTTSYNELVEWTTKQFHVRPNKFDWTRKLQFLQQGDTTARELVQVHAR